MLRHVSTSFALAWAGVASPRTTVVSELLSEDEAAQWLARWQPTWRYGNDARAFKAVRKSWRSHRGRRTPSTGRRSFSTRPSVRTAPRWKGRESLRHCALLGAGPRSKLITNGQRTLIRLRGPAEWTGRHRAPPAGNRAGRLSAASCPAARGAHSAGLGRRGPGASPCVSGCAGRWCGRGPGGAGTARRGALRTG